MFLKHLFNYSIFISVSASWLNGHLVCMVLLVELVSLPLLFAVTLSIITSNIYTRLAACNCISITFWSGDLPSPLMAIF